MDSSVTRNLVAQYWRTAVIPGLMEYMRIPNKSPLFDQEWRKDGSTDRAVAVMESWSRAQPVAGLSLEVVRLEGRTPLLFLEIPGDPGDCVLLYGHLDKQPAMTGWREGLGPWTPVLEGDKLYGRGGADDGYALFASLAAMRALQEQQVPHARCVMLIEACEESGSFDLPYYVEALAGRIGNPSLVICLDSGCANYDQLWCTTSLRGLVTGNLRVGVLKEGVHSGDAGGVVPSSFRLIRQLLSRLEDEKTGEILPREFHAPIPHERLEQAARVARTTGPGLKGEFPFLGGVEPMVPDPIDLLLNRNWRPSLAITGAEGLPALQDAGNVLRPMTAVRISLRIPPGRDAGMLSQRLKDLLEKDPPCGAHVRFEPDQGASGWDAPPFSPWLTEALDDASTAYFGAKAAFMGEGGSIPFMNMLGARFPKAQFLITGVLGPHSNAHGPNEFLHVPTGEKLTCCVAQVIADHYRRTK